MVQRITDTFPDIATTRDQVLKESPLSSYGLLKETLIVKLRKGASRSEIKQLKNIMLAVIEDSGFIFFDSKSFSQDMKQRLKMVEVFSALTSFICFLLGGFQLIMTLSANIKDSMWELGVLRSMGCTRV